MVKADCFGQGLEPLATSGEEFAAVKNAELGFWRLFLENIREWVLEREMVLSGSSRSQLEISSRTILFVKVQVIRKHKMYTVPLLQKKCSLFWPHCLLNSVCLRPEEALRCSGTGVTRDL